VHPQRRLTKDREPLIFRKNRLLIPALPFSAAHARPREYIMNIGDWQEESRSLARSTENPSRRDGEGALRLAGAPGYEKRSDAIERRLDGVRVKGRPAELDGRFVRPPVYARLAVAWPLIEPWPRRLGAFGEVLPGDFRDLRNAVRMSAPN
jgi:hypothetical protein